MKNKILWVMAVLAILAILVSCSEPKASYAVGQEITVSGTMKVIDNDGEYYVLVTENKEFFDIHDIDDKYKQDGVPLKATLVVSSPMCLHGSGAAWKVKEYL